MPTTLLNQSTGFVTAMQVGPARQEYPFMNSASPDVYARLYGRDFVQLATSYAPRIAERTSYTNLLLHSEDLANAAWSSSGSISTGALADNGPDGSTAGTQVADIDGAAYSYRYQSRTVANDSASYTLSAILKRVNGTTSQITLQFSGGTPTSGSAVIDWTTATASAIGGTATVRAMAGGWYLLTITAANNATGNTALQAQLYPEQSSAAGQSTVKVRAMQLELATSAGPYIATTSATRTISSPDVDGIANSADSDSDFFAYLTAESSPTRGLRDPLARFTRTYARIPATQYEPNSLFFSRLSLHDVTDGTYYGVSWDQGRSAWIFSPRKTISAIASLAADTKAITGTTSGSGTVSGTGTIAGTGTLSGTGTLAGQKQAFSADDLPTTTVTIKSTAPATSSFACNASEATIQTVLASLTITASVIRTNTSLSITVLAGSTHDIKSLECNDSTVSISGSGGSYTFSRIKTAAYSDVTDTRATTDTRSLTDTRSTTDTRSIIDTAALTETYSVSASRRLFTTSGAHSASVGDRVAFYNGPRIVALSIVVSVPTTTTFYVPLEDVPGQDFGATTCVFDSAALWRVACTPVDVSARLVRRFYLPGVTTGIASAADIPAITVVTRDPISWLSAVAAYLAAPASSTYAVDSVERLTPWLGGPIIEKAAIEIQMQDAVKTLAVSG
jgi:trimeric autotransporter adhesin